METSNAREEIRTYVPGASSGVEPLIAVFEQIAKQEKWLPGDQLRAHAGRSAYFAIEVEHSVRGGIQLELDDGSGFWSFQYVWPQSKPICDAKTAHIAVLALVPEVRGRQRLFWMPCLEMWRYCRKHGLKDLWLEATPSILAVYRRIGWPLEIVGDIATHWGEECYLCRMGVDEVEAALVRRAEHSRMYSELVTWAHRPED
ncbi:MAG TPA: hypothetical protein VGK19_04460 [Capsulimonadaceae bacterium]|jgi:hypothetical protein